MGWQRTHSFLGGRTVNIIFCTSRSNDYVAKQDGVIFPRSTYSKFAADDHGTKFSCVGVGRYDQWGSCRNDRKF